MDAVLPHAAIGGKKVKHFCGFIRACACQLFLLHHVTPTFPSSPFFEQVQFSDSGGGSVNVVGQSINADGTDGRSIS